MPPRTRSPLMPNMLTPKQARAAMLLALHHTGVEICAMVPMAASALDRAKRLPLFQNQVAAYQQQMFDRLVGQTAAEIMADAPNTFARLKQLREQNAMPQVSLGACRELFARQIPAKTQHQEDHTIRIVLERRDEDHARAVLEEADTIDAQSLHELDDAEVDHAPPAQ